MDDLTHLSLFTGIGEIDLAAEWAGFQTVGQVEQNPYAMRVLRKRFGRKISRWTDIHDLSAEDVRRRTGIDSPTLISGGFPCQPFSCAGKRRGKADDRYLWPEMFRIVRELRSAWVLGENVAGIVNMELEACCADLEGEGYTVRSFLIPACGVGAWHRRERVFIIGSNSRHMPGSTEQECKSDISKVLVPSSTGELYSSDVAHTAIEGIRGLPIQSRRSRSPNTPPIRSGKTLANPLQFNDDMGGYGSGTVCREQQGSAQIFRGSEVVANPNSTGLSCSWITREKTGQDAGEIPTPDGSRWWDIEPAVGRVAHGIPHRVDRLRCLGNAVVPQQVYPILAGIAQIEKTMNASDCRR